jgi:class 3 adenylate cyclase
MPEKVKSLMADCVEEDPGKRSSFEELDMRLKRVDAGNADPMAVPSMKPSNLSLFDIFPHHVVEALRDGHTVEPESRDLVTIFFWDIVGITDISLELEPQKVATMSDRLYTSFHDLSQKHDVFKVETIGDAYMAVLNLVKDQDDHAKRIA